eukprot:1340960-Amorphochlora_amoeboformis.AAC.1
MGLCWCSQVDEGSKRVVMPANDVHLNLEIKGCATAEDVMRYVFDGNHPECELRHPIPGDESMGVLTLLLIRSDVEMPKPGKSHMRVNGVCTSLLIQPTQYGEILPEGIMKALDLLGADNATSLLDVGSGRGTLAFFTFLCYPQITNITGVEISESRFSLCTKAMKRIPCAEVTKNQVSINLTPEPGKTRRLSYYKQNIMRMQDHIKKLSPEIVIFDVEINFGSQELVVLTPNPSSGIVRRNTDTLSVTANSDRFPSVPQAWLLRSEL